MKLFSLRTRLFLKCAGISASKDLKRAKSKYDTHKKKDKYIKRCMKDALYTSSSFINDILK